MFNNICISKINKVVACYAKIMSFRFNLKTLTLLLHFIALEGCSTILVQQLYKLYLPELVSFRNIVRGYDNMRRSNRHGFCYFCSYPKCKYKCNNVIFSCVVILINSDIVEK